MVLGAILSQPSRVDRPLEEASTSSSGLWQISPKGNISIMDHYSRAGEQGPAQASQPHSKLSSDASLSWAWKSRATHLMSLQGMHVLGWGRDQQESWLHHSHSMWSCWTCVPVRSGYCWPSSGPRKQCFNTPDMVCGKVSVLTVFSKNVQVFPAYWNICFDFYSTV